MATDGLGNTVATADVTGFTGLERDGHPFYSSMGGGFPNPYRVSPDGQGNSPLEGAGDLCRYLLERSSLDVDHAAWAAVAGELNEYVLAGFIAGEPVTPWQWLAENVLPLLPITVRRGPRGLIPILWRWGATVADAVDHIEVAPGVERASAVAYEREPSELLTEVVVRWAYDAMDDVHRRETYFCSAANFDAANPEHHPSHTATVAVERYGADRIEDITTDVVYSLATAAKIAGWRISANGLAHRAVGYSVPKHYGWLAPGRVVTLTDADMGWSNRVAFVVSRVRSDANRIGLGLLVTDEPARDMPTA
jgi:hypothetical protein